MIDFDIRLPDAGGIAQEPQQCVLSADETRLFVSALGADRVYVMDVARTDGGYAVLELNPFSGADLYACDRARIVAAVATAARP